MAEFLVKVADDRGHMQEQVESGFSAAEVRDRFTQQGFLVYSVKPRGLFQGGTFNLPQQRKIKSDQFLIFNSQFLTLIRAGLTIVNSIDLLIKRQRNQFFRATLENVRDRVKSGELLSAAFAEQGVFPRMYTTTVLAGEKSGNLEEVLGRYIGFQRMAQTFRKKLQASLIYPAVLVVLVVGMLSFLLTYVVPKFGELYEQISTQGQLPALTLFMLAVGEVARKYALVIVIAVATGVFLLWRWKATEAGARQIDSVRLRLPIIGPIWLKYQIAIFSRTLGTLLSGGIPLVPAIETAAASMQSRSLADALMNASVRVREGQPLAKSLEETKKFPELAVEMIEVGESTGALPAMLTSVAEFYEEDVQTSLSAAMSLIEPAILIVMGVVVAFVLLSLYLPIFTLGAGGIK
ncbi:MAG TPA: type II secretion system F family protein [Terriglobales bacterium]|nr:type II secretion system F family protein [Terriglobales bacterium]